MTHSQNNSFLPLRIIEKINFNYCFFELKAYRIVYQTEQKRHLKSIPVKMKFEN